MDAAKIMEFQQRVTGSIETLREKNSMVETMTRNDAEVLLIYAECIVSCLHGFMFCAEHDEILAKA